MIDAALWPSPPGEDEDEDEDPADATLPVVAFDDGTRCRLRADALAARVVAEQLLDLTAGTAAQYLPGEPDQRSTVAGLRVEDLFTEEGCHCVAFLVRPLPTRISGATAAALSLSVCFCVRDLSVFVCVM
eukprot:SAG31_NODE_3298_length_4446_cov_24.869335_3_plen_130_part_00